MTVTPVAALRGLTDPVERVVTRLREQGCDPRETQEKPGQWYARCPAHDDAKASLAIGPDSRDPTRAGIYCHTGDCSRAEVLRALDLPLSITSGAGQSSSSRLETESAQRAALSARRSTALMTDAGRLDDLLRHEGITANATEALMVGSYGPSQLAVPERDHFDRVVSTFLVVPRYLRDDFPGVEPKRMEEAGTPRAMTYRPGGPASSEVFLVEGAMCALAVQSLGLEAVAMPSSSGWKRPWNRVLKDRDVIILPDADQPGRDAAERAAVDLLPACESVRVAEVYPGVCDGSDVADIVREFNHGHALRELRQAIDATEPIRRAKRGRKADAMEATEDYLRHVLRDGQWHSAAEVLEGRPTVNGRQVSERTVITARKRLGVVSEKRGLRWVIRLPRPRPRRSA